METPGNGREVTGGPSITRGVPHYRVDRSTELCEAITLAAEASDAKRVYEGEARAHSRSDRCMLQNTFVSYRTTF